MAKSHSACGGEKVVFDDPFEIRFKWAEDGKNRKKWPAF